MPGRNVFISYSQPDHEAAHELVERVEARGIQCWIAPRNVDPGEDFAAAIVRAIAAARVMVLVFSASANSSPHVRREVERAVSRGVRVLPFRVADIVPSAALEYFLAGQQWLDAFPPPMEQHYARLCACLGAIQSMPPNPVPLLKPDTEPVIVAPTPPPAPRMPPPPLATARPTPPPAPPPAFELPPEPVWAGPPINDAELQLIEHDLAVYIGPIAKIVVHRALADAPNIDALLTRLGAQIDSEPERKRFLNSSREKLRAHQPRR